MKWPDLVPSLFSSSGRPGQKGIPGVTRPPIDYVRPFGDPGYPGEKGTDGDLGDFGSPGLPGRLGKY